MNLRQRALFFGYPLVEVLAFWAVGAQIGFGWALVALLAGIPIGFAMWRRAARYFASAQPDKAATWSVAGLLWLIPGFVTDLLGTLVVIPAVRTLLAKNLARWLPSGSYQGVLVQGQVIQESNDTFPHSRTQGEFLTGEIAPRND